MAAWNHPDTPLSSKGFSAKEQRRFSAQRLSDMLMKTSSDPFTPVALAC
jgi:hypothetical protein